MVEFKRESEYNKTNSNPSITLVEKDESRKLPSAESTLRQATLRLGGPSGEVVEVKDVRYYLGARLFRHLESGDRTSKDYQLLQQAQDLSSPIGVQAAIEIFKTQFELSRNELSSTPKGARHRDLMREALAFGISIIKVEQMLPNPQKPKLDSFAGGHKITSEQPQSDIDSLADGDRITSEHLQLVLDGFRLRHDRRNRFNQPSEYLELLIKAQGFTKSKQGREAAVQFIEETLEFGVLGVGGEMDKLLLPLNIPNDPLLASVVLEKRASEGDSEAAEKLKVLDIINGKMLRYHKIVRNVGALMGELEKGSKRS